MLGAAARRRGETLPSLIRLGKVFSSLFERHEFPQRRLQKTSMARLERERCCGERTAGEHSQAAQKNLRFLMVSNLFCVASIKSDFATLHIWLIRCILPLTSLFRLAAPPRPFILGLASLFHMATCPGPLTFHLRLWRRGAG